jgi:hypothetical protein
VRSRSPAPAPVLAPVLASLALMAVSAMVAVAQVPGGAHAPVPARVCSGPAAPWLGLEVGAVGYEVTDRSRGLEWGVAGGLRAGATSFRAGYHRIHLTGASATPHAVRAMARRGLLDIGPATLCATVHGGGSHFVAGDDRATVLAGGVGLEASGTLMAGVVAVTPFVEARGLGARSQATILGVSDDATGFSLGVDGGAEAALGRARVRLAGSLEGLAPGLGITPYAGRAVRLTVAYLF